MVVQVPPPDGGHRNAQRAYTLHEFTASMENILPPSVTERKKPLAPTPRMERSVASMSDSFMLEHSYPAPQSPAPEVTNSGSSTLPVNDDLLAPLANLAHLSLVKNQRNSLRSELKAQRAAGAQAKASVASLRRLALRLAVNISLKEKQIATTARSLANSRKSDYVATRNAEQRIETLMESLKEEEHKNREILESLERASMLTLECMRPSQTSVS
jgi:hypothetical protein